MVYEDVNISLVNNMKIRKDEMQTLSRVKIIMGESHIDFRKQRVIMTLAGGREGTFSTFGKVIEFESSCIVICLSYTYLIIDRKRSFINK